MRFKKKKSKRRANSAQVRSAEQVAVAAAERAAVAAAIMAWKTAEATVARVLSSADTSAMDAEAVGDSEFPACEQAHETISGVSRALVKRFCPQRVPYIRSLC